MQKNTNIDTQIKQIDEIIPKARKIKTLKGETIELPTITLGTELEVMRHFFEFLKSGGYKNADLSNQSLQDILLNAFCDEKGNGLILDMFAIITGKPVEWLLDNVDLTSMAECLLPFFVARIQSLTKAMGNITAVGMDTPN